MRRFLAILCTLFILCSSLNLAVFAADGVTENAPENTVKLAQNAEDLVVEGGSTIDLNGYSVNGLTVSGDAAVYITDSATDDYTVADGVYGKISGTIEGIVLPGDGYMQVVEEDGISFHCVNLEIYAMTLRPDAAGVYYTSYFAGDEVVAAQVESYGVALSVKGEPTPGDKNCGYSVFSDFKAGEGANEAASGTLLKNILKTTNKDAANIRNATMAVYGRAYLKTSDGYVFGGTVSRSLKEQVEAVDAVWATLQPKQKAAAAAMYETYPSVMSNWNVPNMVAYSGTEIVPGLDGEIALPISVTTENGVVTEETTVSVEGISVTVPAGVKLAEGATGLTLQVTPLETTEVSIALTDSQVLMPVDVHVEGISAENTVPLTIGLGKVMAENLNMGTYSVYHVENGAAGKMVLIANDKPFTAHNQYKYTLDGELTLHMATFSEIAVVSDVDNQWQGTIDTTWYNAEATELCIRNADQLAGLSAIVGGMNGLTQDSFTGKTVTLLSDIDLGDGEENNVPEKIFYPIGYYNSEGTYEKTGTAITSGFRTFEGTFDGNGHTISNIYQNTWEMKGDNEEYDATLQYYRDGMGLFGKVYGGTVKNLTVRNFKSDGEFTTTGVIAAYADFGATFENISIFNCNPRVYNIGNGGIVGCVGWYTKAVTDEKVSFKNITVDNTNKISALWGSWDVACGGLVGQYYPTSGQTSAGSPANPGIYMENCHISAQMDVYNDVCANYQYYAYRYAGILIGSVRENVTIDGRVYPKMDGIEAKDCTVHFGDWNDYYYCELVDNTTASYTHDYQMSRLVEVKAIEGTTITYLDGTTGTVPASGRANYVIVDYTKGHGTENATCYHFLNGAVWTHEMGGIDEGIDENGDGEYDLKEDKQHIYREFNNLVTGYGWGVTSKAVGELEGVTILDRLVGDSVEKFKATVEADTVFKKGATIALGDLFVSSGKLAINVASVWANAVDTATGIDVATFTQDKSDWTKSTLTFNDSFMGQVKITIQDYQFCQPTVLTIQVGDILEKIAAMDFSKGDGLASGKTFEAYCPVCDETVIWTARIGSSRIEYISKAGNYHYYLSGDVTRIRTEANKTQEFFNNAFDVADINCCLYLNGKNIVADGQIAVSGSATLNILGDGTVTFVLPEDTATITGSLSAALYNNGGTFNIYGGTYTTTAPNKPVILSNNATNTVNIYAGTFIGAANGTVGNVKIANGEFNMYGGTLRDGTGDTGGNLYVSGADVYIGKDAVITGGTAYQGGNIYTTGAITMTTAGTITDGTALTKIVANANTSVEEDRAAGGNIFMSGAPTLNITGGEISNGAIKRNTAEGASVGTWSNQSYGPNIRTYGANVNVSGGLIYGGSSEGTNAEGWNLYTYKNGENGNVTISGGTIVGDVFTYSALSLKLSGAPQIVKSLTLEDGTTVNAQKSGIRMLTTTDISELSPEANICVSANSGAVLCAANANTQNVVTCFTCYDEDVGIYLTTDNSGDPSRQKQDNSINNSFMKVTTGRNKYCQFCDKNVSWVQVGKTTESGRVGYLNNNGSAHYYLNDDFTSIAAQFTDLASTDLCLDLNGKTLTMPGRMHLGNLSASINLVANGGKVVFTGTAGSSYIDAAFVVGSKINVVGGTYTTADAALAAGTPVFLVKYNKEADLTLTDATVDGKLVATTGNTTLAGTTTVDAIEVGPNAKLTIAEGWSGIANVTLTNGATVDGNLIVAGNFTGELICGSDKLIYKDGALVQADRTFDENAKFNYCEHCKTYIADWTPVNNGGTLNMEGTKAYANGIFHYYLADNVTAASGYFIEAADFEKGSLCLNLNGKTLTGNNRNGTVIYCSNSTTISIMGEGTVMDTTAAKLFQVYTCTLNLYGGTYVSTSKVAASIDGGTVNMYGDAKLVGVVNANAGSLSLYDNASIEGLELTGTKITAAASWNGKLTDSIGIPYEKNAEGVWEKATADVKPGEFNPGIAGCYAYCDACEEAVTWTPVTDVRVGYFGANDKQDEHHHYYLVGDLSVPDSYENAMGADWKNTLCLNLNGYNMTFGGRVYIGDTSTVSIMGDGEVTFTAGYSNGVDAAIEMHSSAAQLNLYGGTYNLSGAALAADKPFIDALGSVIIHNGVVVNGYIAADNNSNVTLEGNATVAEIRISGTGKVKIADGWFGSAVLDIPYNATTGAVSADNAAVLGEFTGTLTLPNGRKLVQNGEGLMLDLTFDANYTLNYCEHCKEFVEWTALHEGESIGKPSAPGHYHYYVAEDMTAAKGNFLELNTYANRSNYCINLNGKKLTVYGQMQASFSNTLNIMGGGEIINGGNTSIFHIYTATLNLYSGTYTSESKPAVTASLGSGKSAVNLYGDATISTVLADHVNCLITLDSDWTGSVAIDASTLMVDGKIPTANAVVTGGKLNDNATVTDTAGNALYYTEGQLGYKPFVAEDETNYCRVCNAYVAWEPLPTTWTVVYPAGQHYHYFLDGNVTNTASLLFATNNKLTPPTGVTGTTPIKVCLYLNNNTLTMSKGSINGNGAGIFNIIGDGTVQGGSTTAISCYTGTVNLYGGTYKASATGTVFSTTSSGANLNVYEDAELIGKVSVGAGNVNIHNQANVELIDITGGKTTFQSGWTGSASLTVLESLLENGLTVPTANVKVEGTYNNNITSTQGDVSVANGQITITPTTPAE